MSVIKDKVAPAVIKETKRVAVYSAAGLVIMWAGFYFLKWLWTDEVPTDYRIYTSGIVAAVIAVLNFFIMGISVQKVSAEEDEKKARQIFKMFYTRRLLMQIVWMVVTIVVPCFYWASGIIPLLFPSAGIKIKGIIDQIKYNKAKEVEQKQDGC